MNGPSARNPILARFRKWTEGETLADPSWAQRWLAALDDPSIDTPESEALDRVYDEPLCLLEWRRFETEARRVLKRIDRVARAPLVVTTLDAASALPDGTIVKTRHRLTHGVYLQMIQWTTGAWALAFGDDMPTSLAEQDLPLVILELGESLT